MRDALLVFAVTVYATFPLPVPLVPTLTVIQASLLFAVQLHPAPAVTTTDPLAPIDAVNVKETGEIAATHDMPAWVTVKLCPATIRVLVREAALMLAATL